MNCYFFHITLIISYLSKLRKSQGFQKRRSSQRNHTAFLPAVSFSYILMRIIYSTVPPAMLSRVFLFQRCRRMTDAPAARLHTFWRASWIVSSLKQYTTRAAMIAAGSTFPRYPIILGIPFFPPNNANGSTLVNRVTAAAAAIMQIPFIIPSVPPSVPLL